MKQVRGSERPDLCIDENKISYSGLKESFTLNMLQLYDPQACVVPDVSHL